MKNVTLRQLLVFASVARRLSFTRAAEELSLTAPAVSMQIKEFEAEVGLPVFDRTSRQVSLTMVGEYMLAHARRVLAKTLSPPRGGVSILHPRARRSLPREALRSLEAAAPVMWRRAYNMPWRGDITGIVGAEHGDRLGG